MTGDRTGWTLDAWIEHERALHDMEGRLREADREMLQAEIKHLRELAERQKETNDIYFAQLSKTVTLESFMPFQEYVKDYISAEKGQSVGVSSTMTWVVGIASAIAGAVVAWLAQGGP